MGKVPDKKAKDAGRPFEKELDELQGENSAQISDQQIDKVMNRLSGKKQSKQETGLAERARKKAEVASRTKGSKTASLASRQSAAKKLEIVDASLSQAIDDLHDRAVKTGESREFEQKLQDTLDELRNKSEQSAKTTQANAAVQDAINNLTLEESEKIESPEKIEIPEDNTVEVIRNAGVHTEPIPEDQNQVRNFDMSRADGQYAQPKVNKKRTWLRILLGILGVCVVGIIGAIVWFMAFYSAPTKAISDGMAKFANANERSLSGEYNLVRQDSNYPSQLIIKYQLSSLKLPAELSINANYIVANAGINLTVTFDGIAAEDGSFYLRLDRLSDSIRILQTEVDDALLAVLQVLEGRWWRILPDDLAQLQTNFLDGVNVDPEEYELYDELDDLDSIYPSNDDLSNYYADAYTCIESAIKTGYIGDNSYKDYPFLDVTGKKFQNNRWRFSAKINYDELAKLMNAVQAKMMNSLSRNCNDVFASMTGENELRNTSGADLRKTIPENLTVQITLDAWTHDIENIVFTYEESDASHYFSILPNLSAQSSRIPTYFNTFEDFIDSLYGYDPSRSEDFEGEL